MMRYALLAFLPLPFMFAGGYSARVVVEAHRAACSGGHPCKACKDCTRCKYCRGVGAGSCSVCDGMARR